MLSGRQIIVSFFLCLFLAGWSAEATLLSKRQLSQSKDEDDADSNGGADVKDGDDDDNEDDDDNDGRENKDGPKEDGDNSGDSKHVNKDDGTDGTKVTTDGENDKKVANKNHDDADADVVVHNKAADKDDKKDEKKDGDSKTEAVKASASQQQAASLSQITSVGKHVSQKKKKSYKNTFEEALADNRDAQKEKEDLIAYYTNTTKSTEDIMASAKKVANETESPAMAAMLAKMWKEIRMFDVPIWVQHEKEELKKLKTEEAALMKQLGLAPKEPEQAKLAGDSDEQAKSDGDEQAKSDGKEPQDVYIVEGPNGWDIAKRDINDAAKDFNFWSMSRKQQEKRLFDSVVYIVFGIFFAVLFEKARKHESRHLLPDPRPNVPKASDGFSLGLFGCFNNPKFCLVGCCCPCMVWANTLDRQNYLGPTPRTYWKAFFMFFFLTCLHGYLLGISCVLLCALGVTYRQKLRASWGHGAEWSTPYTKKSVCIDILAWFFCMPCAVIQEAREESAQVEKLDVDF